MQVNDQLRWKNVVEINDDPYGKACVDFAIRWADLMELQIALGKTVEQVAKETSHEANTDGITGFMYGCAVEMLSEFWVRGEELRRWHNLDIQIGREGEKANESGGVLNPAVLVLN